MLLEQLLPVLHVLPLPLPHVLLLLLDLLLVQQSLFLDDFGSELLLLLDLGKLRLLLLEQVPRVLLHLLDLLLCPLL